MIDRKPLKVLFAPEISKGEVNLDRLKTKVAAFLELVNQEFKAFDVKTGKNQRLKYDDAVLVSFKKNNKKVSVKIISPRFEKGQYVAASLSFNGIINGK